jgi:hypothetical protein
MANRNLYARLWWSVPAACILVLMALAMLFGNSPQKVEPGNSYDASNKGFRAAYLLLEQLKYPVVRSKRPAGGAARLVLFPDVAKDKGSIPDEWVQAGGVLVLADNQPHFARQLGMNLQIHQEEMPSEEDASGPGIARLEAGADRVDWPGHFGTVWASAGGKPVITIYSRGRGQIWLVTRPDFLTNRLLRQSDNAILLCRLAEALLQERNGELCFDEYCHGMRERPGVTELLFQPPALWITLQALLLTAVVLWHYVPRFGSILALPPRRRRSREEFLEAMAALLQRKGDYAEAYHTVHEGLVRDIERDLGLPAGVALDKVLREASRRRPLSPSTHQRLLIDQLPPRAGKDSFLRALNELADAREEFFHGRHDR